MSDILHVALSKFNTILLDRNDLISIIESTPVTADTWLLTFDVESLYPNINQVDCAEACAIAVDGSQFYKSMVYDIMLYILKHNIVQVGDDYYLQTSGGAMGTNCLPQAAQLYLAVKWEAIIQQKLGADFPTLFKRFLDDGFVLFTGTEQQLQSIIQVLATTLPNIRITYNYSKTSVEYMDLVVYKDHSGPTPSDMCLKVRTHQKPLNKYLYIPPFSFHSKGVFKGFIRAELVRYIVTNTDVHWYNCMVAKFRHRLLQRGYNPSVVDAAIASVSFDDRHTYLHRGTRSTPAHACTPLVVPHVAGVPDMHLQQMLHCIYDASPDVHSHISRPLVCFTKGSNLGAFLVNAGA
jgi:hypothetical protein